MDQKKLTLALTLLIVIIGSIFLGSAVGQNDLSTAIIAVAVLGVLITVIALGESIWVIIPVLAAWSSGVPLLPLPFSVANLAIMLAVGFWFLSVATRRQQWSFKFDRIDFVLVLTVILLMVGYFRNPIGLSSLASGGNIGGRPYVETAVALVAYLILAGQQAKGSLIEKLPRWIIISAGVLAVGGGVAAFIPQAGIVLYQFYSGFLPDMGELLDPYGEREGVGKSGYLRPLAFALAAYVVARCSPIRLMRPENFWLVAILAFATVLAALTAYRSALIAVGFYFVAASWLWLRGLGLILCGFLGVLFVAALISLQSFVPLPEKVQRSFAFLPGNWDQRVEREAEGSVDWRVEMWEDVIYGDNIKNWWIGDGFGFPQSEVEYYGYLHRTKQISPQQLAEYYLITGGLHSGPLSAAKFVGVIGGLLYLVLSFMVIAGYLKLWKMLAGYDSLNRLRVSVAFFGITAFYIPFKFVFIYGAYQNDLGPLIVSAGLYRLIASVARREMAEADMEVESKLELSSPA